MDAKGPFTLRYRHGASAREEKYSSSLGAIGRATVLLCAGGFADFSIHDGDGNVVMNDGAIVAAMRQHC